jgi:hypothetical protein
MVSATAKRPHIQMGQELGASETIGLSQRKTEFRTFEGRAKAVLTLGTGFVKRETAKRSSYEFEPFQISLGILAVADFLRAVSRA